MILIVSDSTSYSVFIRTLVTYTLYDNYFWDIRISMSTLCFVWWRDAQARSRPVCWDRFEPTFAKHQGDEYLAHRDFRAGRASSITRWFDRLIAWMFDGIWMHLVLHCGQLHKSAQLFLSQSGASSSVRGCAFISYHSSLGMSSTLDTSHGRGMWSRAFQRDMNDGDE